MPHHATLHVLCPVERRQTECTLIFGPFLAHEVIEFIAWCVPVIAPPVLRKAMSEMCFESGAVRMETKRRTDKVIIITVSVRVR